MNMLSLYTLKAIYTEMFADHFPCTINFDFDKINMLYVYRMLIKQP